MRNAGRCSTLLRSAGITRLRAPHGLVSLLQFSSGVILSYVTHVAVCLSKRGGLLACSPFLFCFPKLPAYTHLLVPETAQKLGIMSGGDLKQGARLKADHSAVLDIVIKQHDEMT